MGKDVDGEVEIIVVGDGIAANCLLYFLVEKNRKNSRFPCSIVQISSPDLLSPCSERDLVFVSDWGQGAERSPYPQAPEQARAFYLTNFASSTQVMRHFYWQRPEKETTVLGVYPKDLLVQMRKALGPQVGVQKDFLLQIEKAKNGHVLHLRSQKKIRCRSLILATGAFDFLLPELGMEQAKGVGGSYVAWKAPTDFSDESYLQSFHGFNFCYDKNSSRLWLGGTKDHTASLLARQDLIDEMIEKFLGMRPELASYLMGAPEIVSTGVRPKFSKKTSLFGRIPNHPGIYYLNGLYKNGFSYSPWLAQILVESLYQGDSP